MSHAEVVVERVTREDLVMFVNACFACTGQREFYSGARGEGISIDFLHRYILTNYRRLYARTLAAGINHFNQAEIVVNLLATGKDTPAELRREEGALIRAALTRLPPPRAYRVLEALRDRKINNRRARAAARDYLRQRPEIAFDAVKYRRKLRAVATHAHLRLEGELGPFLFRGWMKRVFTTELFERYRQAFYSEEAVYELPYTVAEGFCVRHEIPRDRFLARIADRMTAAEKLRHQESARSAEVALEIDLGRVPLTRLALYVLALPAEERARRKEELDAALARAARRAFDRAPKRLGRVAAVLDRSWSSSGSSEKHRRPLAVALASSELLAIAAREYRAFWTPGGDPARASGQTDLATPLLDALEWGPDLVVLISDGWENDPPHGAREIARVFRRRIDRAGKVSMIHLNPVFDADHHAPRTIGPEIPTVGIRDAEDLLTALSFARFAEGSAPLAELEHYLSQRVEEMLSASLPEGSR